jgi:hypothetical protein
MCHTYAPTGQRIDGARFLTETFVPGAYYFNLAAEADAQRRHFTAFGLYLAGNAEFVLTVLSAGTGAAFTVPGRAPAVTRMVNPRSLISRQGRD